MIFTPGLNFINVLRTAFMHVDPESVRIQSNPQYLFTLLESTCAKAARRTLMKLTPGRSRDCSRLFDLSSSKRRVSGICISFIEERKKGRKYKTILGLDDSFSVSVLSKKFQYIF